MFLTLYKFTTIHACTAKMENYNYASLTIKPNCLTEKLTSLLHPFLFTSRHIDWTSWASNWTF